MRAHTARAATIMLALSATLAACGGSSGPVPENPAARQAYTPSQIIAALHLTADPNQHAPPGITVAHIRAALGPAWGLWDAPTGCTVAVVMTTPAEIQAYIGDSIATNPSRTAGVKYGGDHPSACYRTFTRRLSALR